MYRYENSILLVLYWCKLSYGIADTYGGHDFLLFRVVEIHRICEATATPYEEGASLSENAVL